MDTSDLLIEINTFIAIFYLFFYQNLIKCIILQQKKENEQHDADKKLDGTSRINLCRIYL